MRALLLVLAAGALAPGPVTIAQISELIGDARCTQDGHCRVLAVGERPCGGAEQFLAWSTQGSDEARLLASAERHARQRRIEHRKSGLESTCAVLPTPSAACERAGDAGRCVLQPGAGDRR